ncbi:MAG: stage 0 sporulation family protein [Ruminococcus sp.]|nr:stage 0 sporulation protein [Ruminococcus sp.]MBQ9957032.1 stage 0 sporulation family protein [Ruminococcus sp.]MBR6792686.1 stage 0 sporulation family protein [Ruminococcus sp.]
MKEIVGVRFKSVGKIYYFSPGDIKANSGDYAIVETVRGIECGEVAIPNRMIEDNQISSPLKPIIRLATPADLKIVEKNKQKEKEAFTICQEKINARGLDMHLVDVECTFDNNKLLFYFTSENRVDFRELVKDLASVFRTRIELRQIGVRDEAKILGGLGICGREFCCKGYMGEFQPVSIKMAKEQGLSLNPTKISGTCGRLMCCLKNEQNAYEALLKITPKIGAIVVTPDGDKGKVEDANLITGKLRIKTENSEVPVTLDRSEVKLLKDAEIRVNRDELRALKALEDK